MVGKFYEVFWLKLLEKAWKFSKVEVKVNFRESNLEHIFNYKFTLRLNVVAFESSV